MRRAQVPPRGARGGCAVVLVVDNETARAIYTEVFRTAGYEVLSARTGEQAAARGLRDRRVQLVIIDLLARARARKLFGELRAGRPELHVLLAPPRETARVPLEESPPPASGRRWLH